MTEPLHSAAPDEHCYTLPNGECVSTKACMHGPGVASTPPHYPLNCNNLRCPACIRIVTLKDALRGVIADLQGVLDAPDQ